MSKHFRPPFKRVVSEGHRAAQIIAGVRAMFRKDLSERSPVTINELVCDVVSTSLGELKSCHVSLALELLDDLWPILADRVQLQQVLLNLLTNALDAMAPVTDRPHVLHVRSEHLDDCVLISANFSTPCSLSAIQILSARNPREVCRPHSCNHSPDARPRGAD